NRSRSATNYYRFITNYSRFVTNSSRFVSDLTGIIESVEYSIRHDVRDYKAKIGTEFKSWGPGSPFNIKSDSLFLKNFTKEEVITLLDQHTTETNQVFPDDVKEGVFHLSGGQPWLVNALARQMVSKILGVDYTRPITRELLSQAKQQLILRRDTHLDNLVDKLKKERVRRIV
ncbi:MAG: hypothetical protein GY940_06200, partial [bacterium]|nr:hypothetical protein [bacterium]